MNKSDLLVEILNKNIKTCKLGIIVKSVRNITPSDIVTKIDSTEHLYVSVVGYNKVVKSELKNVTISDKIEDAVLWRSDPKISGNIIVFINGEVDKLHSLSEFDVLTGRDMMHEMLKKTKEEASSEPVRKLLDYFISTSSHFTYEDMEKFLSISCVNWGSCGDNLWILNRLCDHEILSKKDKIKERLDDNCELVDTLAILPDGMRQQIYRTLSKYSDEDEIKQSFNKLSKFIESNEKDDLKGLEYDKVKVLLLGKKKDARSVVVVTPPIGGSSGSGSTPTPPTPRIKEVKTSEFEAKVAEIVVAQDEDSMDLLRELYISIEESLINQDNPIFVQDGGPLFDNRPLKIDVSKPDFKKNIGRVCSDESWGGIMETKDPVLRSSLSSVYDNEVYPFNPSKGDCPISITERSIIDVIKSFDELLNSDSRYEPMLPSFEKLTEARKKLTEVLDSIMFFPTIAFGVFPERYNALKEYISSWDKLFSSITNNEPLMREKSISSSPLLIRSILSLDILYVQTPTEWKAVLLPLHPLYLWKYNEIFFNLIEQRADYTDNDFDELKKVLHSLPQTLNFVIIDKAICKKANIELPYSGNVEMLPAYENKTNRYLGKDGIECVPETILRWLEFAPFTRRDLRISVTDAPDASLIIKDLVAILENGNCEKINVTFFYTRTKKEGNDYAIIDHADSDEKTLKYISAGDLQISSHNIDGDKEAINDCLKNYPVHVAFFFDQLEYSIGHAKNNKNLYISPLVVTYDYNFDEVLKRGEIFPSSEMDSGIIGNYQTLLYRANMVTSSDIPHPTLSRNNNIKHATSTISQKQAQWLVVADRSISQYQPEESFPIGEKDFGRRIMSIWASENSRVISNYDKLLHQYNLYPNQNNLVKILSEFGHISSEGLVTIPKYGASKADSEKKQKGLLGTVFAACWYNKNYPSSLIASLDDKDARLWLNQSDSTNERADLIGLRFNEETQVLTIQPIEVKTWASDNDPVKISKDPTTKESIISGHAADQVAKTTQLLNSIFDNSGTSLNIFSAARKEALKYHIVSECFRVSHNSEWQSAWSKILKRAFSESSGLNIEIKGVVVHVDFESSISEYIESCKNVDVEDIEMSFLKLGTDKIQEDILGSVPSTIPATDEDIISVPDSSTDTTHIDPSTVTLTDMDATGDDLTTETVTEIGAEEVVSTLESPIASDKTLSGQSISTSISADVKELEQIRKWISDFKKSCSVYNISLDYCSDAENAKIGPNLVRVQFSLSRGQLLNPLQSKIEDISREMEVTGVTIQSIKNSRKLNLDIPRSKREVVHFNSVINNLPPVTSPEQLFFAVGRTPDGEDVFKNLAEMPHMLVAGSTGSGKSVFLFTLLVSLLKTHKSASELQILLSSSGLEDFIMFNELPHLIGGKVIDDASEAAEMIRTTVIQEFNRREKIMSAAMVPNIIEYNKIAEEKLAPIVVIIDEFADLADQFSNTKERDAFFNPVKRIAQIGRKRGIHLVLCTQRPSATLVPSYIKSQITGRVALRVNDANSSRMILEDSGDARFLLKHGDMIYKNADEKERAQGYFISMQELKQITDEIKSYNSK